MSADQHQRFEHDIQAAVFRVMRHWQDKPTDVRRRDFIAALLTVAHAQLEFVDQTPYTPRT